MKEAFDYMFNDNKFNQKALTYFVLAFFGTIFSNLAALNEKSLIMPMLTLVGLIIMLIPVGYVVSCIKALIEQKENFVLPIFNFKNNFILGFKFAIATLILSLTFGLAIAILALVISFVASILKAKILVVIGALVLLIPILILAYYTLALNWIFATTEAFTSFLQFKKAAELIKKNTSHYLKSFWTFFGVNFAVAIITGIVLTLFGRNFIGMVIATLIAAALSTYVAFVNALITAKSVEA